MFIRGSGKLCEGEQTDLDRTTIMVMAVNINGDTVRIRSTDGYHNAFRCGGRTDNGDLLNALPYRSGVAVRRERADIEISPGGNQ